MSLLVSGFCIQACVDLKGVLTCGCRGLCSCFLAAYVRAGRSRRRCWTQPPSAARRRAWLQLQQLRQQRQAQLTDALAQMDAAAAANVAAAAAQVVAAQQGLTEAEAQHEQVVHPARFRLHCYPTPADLRHFPCGVTR